MTAEHPIMHRVERVKTRWRLFVLASLLGGAAAIVAGPLAAGLPGLVLGLAFAGGVWSAAAIIHFMWLAEPRPGVRVARATTPVGEEFHVGLRPQLPLMMLAAALMFLLLFGAVPALLGTTAWRIVATIGALIGLCLLPDAIRALLSGGRGLRIDGLGLSYRGYSYEMNIAWDDLAAIAPDNSNQYLPAMRFTLQPRRTLIWTRRRWIAHFEPPPKRDQFAIPALALDEPWGFYTLCDQMISTPSERRASFLAEFGERLLTDPLPTRA